MIGCFKFTKKMQQAPPRVSLHRNRKSDVNAPQLQSTALWQDSYYELLNSAPWVDYFKQAGRETLEGSFSAVSTPMFASKYSFFRIFRDLSDSHPFAPLQIQNFQFFFIFRQKSRDFSRFCRIFAIFLRKFHRILSEFREILDNCRMSVSIAKILKIS
jgi:hypothetical protein